LLHGAREVNNCIAEFSNLIILASLAVVFPVRTTDVERGFLAQNALKTRAASIPFCRPELVTGKSLP